MTNYWPNRSFIVVDTETTGLDLENDRPIEIGVAVFLKSQLVWTFDWLLNTKKQSNPDAVAVHGITDEERWEKGVDSKSVCQHLIAMFRRNARSHCPVVVFNAQFDFSILHAEFDRFKLEYDFDDVNVIDPLVIERHFEKNIPIFTKPWMRQQQMALRYGITPPNHRALADAICTGNIALAQTLHHPGIRHMSVSELHRTQEKWFAEFKTKVDNFAKKKSIEFSMPSWPFGGP